MQEAVHVMGARAGSGRTGCRGLSPGVYVRCTALAVRTRPEGQSTSALVQRSGPAFHARALCSGWLAAHFRPAGRTSGAHARAKEERLGINKPKPVQVA